MPIVVFGAGALILIGRLSRWRPHWLLLPAVGAVGWLTVSSWSASRPAELTGVHAALAATSGRSVLEHLAAQSGRLARLAAAVATQPDRLLHPAAVLRAGLGGTGRWLPVYLLAATGEAALVLWLRWRRSRPDWRPGLVAALRTWAAVRALAAGRTVTLDGCSLGVDLPAGRLSRLSWAAAEHGVLLAGPDEQQLAWPGLAVVCAAIRRRKTVLVLDLAGGAGDLARRVAALAAKHGVQVSEAALAAGGLPASALHGLIGRAVRRREVVAIRALPGAAAQSAGAEQSAPAGPAAADARAAVNALTTVLASLRDLGLRGDCLVWVAGCETLDDGALRELLALAPATGTAVLLSTGLLSTGLPGTGLPGTGLPGTGLPGTGLRGTGQQTAGDVGTLARLAAIAGLVIVADAVPGRFALQRAGGRAPQIIRAVPCELAAWHSS